MKARCRVILQAQGMTVARIARVHKRWAIKSIVHRSQVMPSALLEAVDWSDVSTTVREAIVETHSESLPIDLLIPACWCYCHQLGDSDRRLSETAAAFALEEFIPLSLEEVTTALARDSDSTWAIAVRTLPMRQLLDSLEHRGVIVESIYVDAFAAVQLCNVSSAQSNGMIIEDGDRITFMAFEHGRVLPIALRAIRRPPGTDAVSFIPKQVALTKSVNNSEDRAWCRCILDGPIDDGIGNANTVEGSGNGVEQRLNVADLLRSELDQPYVPNLRTGTLALGTAFDALVSPATRLVALLVVFLVALLIIQRSAIRDCRQLVDAVSQKQVELFHEVLPESTLRAGAALQMASERRRLEALTNRGMTSINESAAGYAGRFDVIDDLRDFVVGLPEDIRVLVLEANIDSQQFALRGRTVDHQDAERIAECVNGLAAVAAPPPRTSRVGSGGVEFSIRAQRE